MLIPTGGLIVSDKVLVAVRLSVPVPVAVKDTDVVPGVVGVPLTTPVAGLRVRPAGSVLLLQAIGAVPLLALSVKLTGVARYMSLNVAGVVLIVIGVVTVIESGMLADSRGTDESTAVMVKLLVPAVVGVPLIIPVADASDRPAGSVPAETLHVYGAVPPDKAS